MSAGGTNLDLIKSALADPDVARFGKFTVTALVALVEKAEAEVERLRAALDGGQPRPAHRDLPAVDGSMQCSIAAHERACLVLIDEEQRKIAPDNHLLATLCDAVRLGREYGAWVKRQTDRAVGR